MYVHTHVTAVFPWLTHALLSDTKMKRKPRRLMDVMLEAVAFLDKDVRKRHKTLMKTIDWSPDEPKPDPSEHTAYVR